MQFPSQNFRSRCAVRAALLLVLLLNACGGTIGPPPEGARAWTAATLVSTADAHPPALAVAPAGQAVMAWGEGSGGSGGSFVRRHAARADWQAREAIGVATPQGAYGHQLAVNDAGDIVVAWVQYGADTSSPHIMVNRFVVGTGWKGPEYLDAANLGVEPQVAVDAGGNAVVAWKRPGAGAGSLVSARSARSGGWSAPQIHFDGLSELSLQALPSGRILLVFSGRDAQGVLGTWSIDSNATSGWSLPVAVSVTRAYLDGFLCSPQPCRQGDFNVRTATSPAGWAAVSWESYDVGSGVLQVWLNVFTPAGGWEGPTLVGSVNASLTLSAMPQVAFDADTSLLVVWQSLPEQAASRREFWMRRFAAAQGGSVPTRVAGLSDGRVEGTVQLACAGAGGVLMSWATSGVQVARWRDTSGWSAPVMLDTFPGGTLLATVLGSDAAGHAMLLWWRPRAIQTDSPRAIWSSRAD